MNNSDMKASFPTASISMKSVRHESKGSSIGDLSPVWAWQQKKTNARGLSFGWTLKNPDI